MYRLKFANASATYVPSVAHFSQTIQERLQMQHYLALSAVLKTMVVVVPDVRRGTADDPRLGEVLTQRHRAQETLVRVGRQTVNPLAEMIPKDSWT